MANKQETWGLCKECKWWQIEPDAVVGSGTLGMCIDEELIAFQLSIGGNGGCNRFMEDEPARAAGSSDRPPTAKASR